MRVQLSILLFVGLFVGLLALRFPDRCLEVDPDAVPCPETDAEEWFDNYRPIPGICGLYQQCLGGCPVAVRACIGCKPFNPNTGRCYGQDALSCDVCAE